MLYLSIGLIFSYNYYMQNITKIAHRGASGHEPENTIRAFKKAIELGADIVELDVRLCKSGEAVVIHDTTVNRTTNGRGKVNSMSTSDLKKLDAGNGETVPLLQEVLDLTANKCGLVIEIKSKKAAKEVINLIENYNTSKPLIISTIHKKIIKYAVKKECKAARALIFYSTESSFRQVCFTIIALLLLPITRKFVLHKARSSQAEWIHISKEFAHKKFIKKIKSRGFKIAIWAVNRPRKIKKLQSYGVDAIMSDYPDRL